MAQHDYNIANATGLNFRGDINAMAQAIVSINSGSTAPVPAFAGMLWLDLSGGGDGIVRRRNQANNAWLNDIGIDQVARDQANAATVIAQAAVVRAGDTMTGPLNLPLGTPTNNQAVSRAAADVLYQVKLPAPIGGSLLVGAAGGWLTKLDPGPTGSILTISGGVPTYQQAVTTASPNGIVRTLADGTIDASFIPQVASGLRYCGTFKPVVNDEYPTTGDNGHGTGGAPVIGDFWVIDGLTTGGYTYLTGSLAGVTVYNGDSIAYADPTWYRMGSSVSLQGYLKTDGSSSMAGSLNMAANSIINAGDIIGRTGAPLNINNYKIDSSNVVVSPQRGTTGADLPALETGQLGTDLGRMTIFVGASGVNTSLLPVRFFSSTATYAQGVYVVNGNGGPMVRAKAAVAAGAFTASQWYNVMDSSGGLFTGSITVQNDSAQIWIKTNNGWTYNFALGTDGKFYLSDSANSTYAWFYEASQGTRFRGRVMADTDVFTKSGFFCSEAGHAVLAVNTTTATPGTIYLRPNGINEALGQFIIRGTNGQMESYGDVISGGKVASQTGVFSSNIASCVLSTASAGGIYLRPNGAGNSAGEFVVFPTGQISVSGVLYVGTGEFRSTIASCVLSANNGLIYLRPQGGTGAQAYINNSNGDMAIAGTMYAANIPGSDARLKEHIDDVATRDLSALPFKSFNFIGKTDPQRGPIAQDVLAVAPEYVIEYDCIDPAMPAEDFGDGEEPQMVTRYTLNYGGLAIEMALNALQRVAALEAIVSPPEPGPESTATLPANKPAPPVEE